MKYYIFKFFIAVAELYGRLFVFNTVMPLGGRVKKNVKYIEKGSRKQALDIHMPDEQKGLLPVLVFFHGGGVMCMDKKSYRRISNCFSEEGFIVFNANYRLAPGSSYPYQLEDVANAISWVYENAEKFGGDKDRVFLGGDSAGAFFASWYAAALMKDEMLTDVKSEMIMPIESIKGLILFYGVFNWATMIEKTVSPFKWMAKIICNSFLGEDDALLNERAQRISPAGNICEGYPPCILISGKTDPIFHQSKDFAVELDEKNVSCKRLFFSKIKYPYATHAFLNIWFYKVSRISMLKASEFMKNLA